MAVSLGPRLPLVIHVPPRHLLSMVAAWGSSVLAHTCRLTLHGLRGCKLSPQCGALSDPGVHTTAVWRGGVGQCFRLLPFMRIPLGASGSFSGGAGGEWMPPCSLQHMSILAFLPASLSPLAPSLWLPGLTSPKNRPPQALCSGFPFGETQTETGT